MQIVQARRLLLSFKYLLRHGYCSYVEWANDAASDATNMDFSAWEQATSRAMYYFASSVSDQLLSYIRNAKRPNDAWGNLKKISAVSTTSRKLQPRQQLSNVWQKDMWVADYTSKIKEIFDSLASINVIIEKDEMVQVYLRSSDHSWWQSARERIRCPSSSCSQCFSLKKITRVCRLAHTPTIRCCTRRRIGHVLMVYEAGRCAMEAADKSRKEGIIKMCGQVSHHRLWHDSCWTKCVWNLFYFEYENIDARIWWISKVVELILDLNFPSLCRGRAQPF